MIGDIFVFSRENVSALIYHTHDNKFMGNLIRVFCRKNSHDDPIKLIRTTVPVMTCFFPVGAAVKRKILHKIATKMPEGRLRDFPIFKCEEIDIVDGADVKCWLWDGSKEWIYDGECSDLKEYPIREIINDTMMISRLDNICDCDKN